MSQEPEELTSSELSVWLLEKLFKEAKAVPIWDAEGNMGYMAGWRLENGEQRIVHKLPGNNGVEVYRPIPAETFEELQGRALQWP